MNVDEYLKRINCEGLKDVSLENLQQLQKNHFKTFAFENADIHLGKRVELSLEKIYDKLMNQSRGGYCLELNPIFGWLLGELGYEYCYVPTYIYIPLIQRYNANMTHIVIVVKMNGRQYYVDVGVPRFISEPLEIELDRPQKKRFGTYKFKKDSEDGELLILERIGNRDFILNKQNWVPHIKFKLKAQKLQDFQSMSDIVQDRRLCTMFYKSLFSKQSDNSMIILVGWKFSEITFNDDDEYRTDTILSSEEVRKVLRERFGLIIDDSFEPKDDPYLCN